MRFFEKIGTPCVTALSLLELMDPIFLRHILFSGQINAISAVIKRNKQILNCNLVHETDALTLQLSVVLAGEYLWLSDFEIIVVGRVCLRVRFVEFTEYPRSNSLLHSWFISVIAELRWIANEWICHDRERLEEYLPKLVTWLCCTQIEWIIRGLCDLDILTTNKFSLWLFLESWLFWCSLGGAFSYFDFGRYALEMGGFMETTLEMWAKVDEIVFYCLLDAFILCVLINWFMVLMEL